MPTYTFTGTNGAAWGSPWVNSTTWGKGVASIQNNMGRMTTGAIGGYNWQDQCRVNYSTTPANVEILFTVTLTNTDQIFNLVMRNAANDADSEVKRMEIKFSGGTVNVQESGNNDLTSLGTFAFNPGTAAFKVRAQINGMAFKIRTWLAANAEPGTWNAQYTVTKVGATGSLGFFSISGAAAVARIANLDDVTVTDLSAVTPTVTLTAPATASGTATKAITPFTLTSSTNDSATVTYSATNLPAGISLNGTTGQVTGTPTTPGTPTTTFTATSSTGATDSKTTAWTIAAAPTVTLTAPATASGQVGVAITPFTLTSSTNDSATVTYSATNLPAGISLNSSTGQVSGTPTTAGTPTTTFTATSSTGATNSKTTAWTISAVPTVTMTAPATATGRATVPFSGLTLTATTNDSATVTFAGSGLPPGLTVNSSGVVSGTPTTAGSYTATWTATSSTGATDSKTTAFTINAAPTVTLTAPATASGTATKAITPFTLTSSTNDGGTVTYSATGLPAGISLNSSSGQVSGTPTTAGTPTTTFKATSSSGPTQSKTTAWTIAAAPTVTLTAPAGAAGVVGRPITSFTLTSSTNDSATVTYSATGLPAGLSLNSSTGQVSGTPTAATTATTTWTATSSTGATNSKTTAWSIDPAPTYVPRVFPPLPPRYGWSFSAVRLNGDGTETTLAVDLPLSSPNITDELSAADTFSATIKPEIQAYKTATGQPLFLPWSTALYVEKDGIIRNAFILTKVSPHFGELLLEGVGFTGYLNGLPWTNSVKKLYSVDPAEVIRLIWTYAQLHPRGNLGMILTPGNLATPNRLGVKVAEVKSGTTVTKEAQDEPVLLANYATHDLGQLFDEVAAAGSIDYTERHTRQGDGTVKHELVLAYPRLGARRTDIRFVIGENVIPVPPMDLDYEDYASEVVVLGAGEGDKMIRGHAYNPNADRLRRVDVQIAKHVGRTETALVVAANRAKAMNADGLDVDELTVLDHPYAPLFSWGVGDEVRLTGDSGWGGPVDIWVRVLSSSYAPAERMDRATLRVARAERV